MNKLRILGLSILLLAVAGCATHRPNVYTKPGLHAKPFTRVAVLTFQSYKDQPTSGYAASDALVIEFLRRGYQVAEREAILKVLEEKKLSLSGVTANDVTEIGRVLNVELLILGSVTDYERLAIGGGVGGFFAGGSDKVSVGLSLRAIDIDKGEVVYVGQSSIQCGSWQVGLEKLARQLVTWMQRQIPETFYGDFRNVQP